MITKRIDAKGLSCPQPAEMFNLAVAEGNTELEIIIDNKVARENVTRLVTMSGPKLMCYRKDQIS